MENETLPIHLSVSDFIALTNQTLEYAFPVVRVEGEVTSFKINQGQYVFFDLKDAGGSIGCFMMAWQLRVPIEDGMKVVVTASPKLTQKGKFSLTIRAVQPSGEGSLKKSFELLKAKLVAEGLFASERKRSLPEIPHHIAVISSTEAAGYADFVKILNDRWGGVRVDVAHVQVQGVSAPDQIIKALKYFNTLETLPEVIVIIRGGGSADDLSVFNDEPLVREIAASRIPTLVGVGHEVDITLADMAADVRAATPSNAAQIVVPDKKDVINSVRQSLGVAVMRVEGKLRDHQTLVRALIEDILSTIEVKFEETERAFLSRRQVLRQVDPSLALKRGYAIIRGEARKGEVIEIEKSDILIQAEVRNVRKK
jgi:exodeoxyribonuclease VII large subunit